MTDHRFSSPTVMPLRAVMPRSNGDAPAGLVELAYELLDAHADTTALVAGDASDSEWANHLAYLRDLQRVGRERLGALAA
jgi:hypothetical protein